MGLLQKLLGIDEGGYSDTFWCFLGMNKDGSWIMAPCDIIEEDNNGTLVRRKTDGVYFLVGVTEGKYSPDYG